MWDPSPDISLPSIQDPPASERHNIEINSVTRHNSDIFIVFSQRGSRALDHVLTEESAVVTKVGANLIILFIFSLSYCSTILICHRTGGALLSSSTVVVPIFQV